MPDSALCFPNKATAETNNSSSRNLITEWGFNSDFLYSFKPFKINLV